MRYLHTMIRVTKLDESLKFFNLLGLNEISRSESELGRFTLVFLASEIDVQSQGTNAAPMIELTYNWDLEEYQSGRNFGHLAYEVDDIYSLCQKLAEHNVTINRPPRDGRMAFIKSPDGISVELLQKGTALELKEPWSSMENLGSW